MIPAVDILVGDCRQLLSEGPADSINCIVTSPPYFGLRDYNMPGQLGLEPTPEAFVENLVDVFREARRVLRDDGTLWLNLGDTYSGSGRGGNPAGPTSTLQGSQASQEASMVRRSRPAAEIGATARDAAVTNHAKRLRGSVNNKQLLGMPWRVALALQADGWFLRQDIIWHKPNPMPESVRDRCTKAHEYLFLLSKSERYYFDHEAIKEPAALSSVARLSQPGLETQAGSDRVPGKTNGRMKAVGDGKSRHKRSVWTIATKGFKGAHFATFPPALVEPCILAGCPAGGTVLDPFAGTGTTALVARKHGRNAVLLELNPEYARMAEARLA